MKTYANRETKSERDENENSLEKERIKWLNNNVRSAPCGRCNIAALNVCIYWNSSNYIVYRCNSFQVCLIYFHFTAFVNIYTVLWNFQLLFNIVRLHRWVCVSVCGGGGGGCCCRFFLLFLLRLFIRMMIFHLPFHFPAGNLRQADGAWLFCHWPSF